ncbi:MAG TPA: MCE family protein [Marmoricola sp.]|jgi:phospholipid/cholesterol/gamma-HCH transport system substrate-binding protein|nr:MCE family protein [Marmoricola sp.]
MTGLRTTAVKFGAFALVSVLLGVLLINTMLNRVPGDTDRYTADFADVAGLRVGDDVRVAGVRVGRVGSIAATRSGARVRFDLSSEQPVLRTTRVVMRYQNLLGQRYLALVQGAERGPRLQPGSTIPMSRTSPGLDLTELLNGFRPLFEALRPQDVNALATSLVQVLQGEGGTVASLLEQTGRLTNRLADRDDLFDQVLTNLTPVLEDLAGQGGELRGTVRELRALMTGLARDRRSIGASIDGMSRLIGSTSDFLADARRPTAAAVRRFRDTLDLFDENTADFVAALRSFDAALAALGRTGSYSSALNIYLCSTILAVREVRLNLNGGYDGPWSEVCR